MELNKEQIVSLMKFALDVLEDWPEVGHLDMGDLQDIAEKHKILVPQIVHTPCDVDNCVCAEMCSDEDFARGVTCYHIADWLDPRRLTTDEAVEAGQVTLVTSGELVQMLNSLGNIVIDASSKGYVSSNDLDFANDCLDKVIPLLS